MFHAEGTASAESLGWEHCCCIGEHQGERRGSKWDEAMKNFGFNSENQRRTLRGTEQRNDKGRCSFKDHFSCLVGTSLEGQEQNAGDRLEGEHQSQHEKL